MLQDSDLIVPWLVLNTIGKWFLGFLLITYASATWLPQRNNPYLLNFVLATLLAAIPPSLLLYSGHLYTSVPSHLCMAQASLVTGCPPMFAIAQLTLVFDTWSELRSLCLHKKHFSRMTFVICIALIAPYFVFGFWSFAAYQATLGSNFTKSEIVPPVQFVYCRASGIPTQNLQQALGFFVLAITAIQVFFEVWVAWMIYSYPCKVQDDPKTWRTNIQFALRVIILGMVQLLTVFMNVLNTNRNVQSEGLKRADELLVSMNALAAFLVIGLQTNVLLTWKYALLRLWAFITRKKPENPDELQPQGYPALDWAFVPTKNYEHA